VRRASLQIRQRLYYLVAWRPIKEEKMSDPGFVCAACSKEFEGDVTNVMTECKVCKRLHCGECVDEFGRCTECAETKSDKD
jgi:hypothetical protein